MKSNRQIHLEEQEDAGRFHAARRFFRPGDGFRAAALVIRDLSLAAWYGSPLHYWGWEGCLWQTYRDQLPKDAGYNFGTPIPQPGSIRSPFGGVIESIVRRRRRCIWCQRWFNRKGWWNPLAGVNIFEEHCSQACADEEIDTLPY